MPNTSTTQAMETVLVTVLGAILHLIQKDSSVHLASNDLSVASIGEGDKVVAVLGGNQVKWPLANDVAAVKLDVSHYFFTARELEVLNYGLTVVAKGQERALQGARRGAGEVLLRVEGESGGVGGAEARVSKKEELEVLNYGLTVVAKGQERALQGARRGAGEVLLRVEGESEGMGEWEVLDASVLVETSPEELRRGGEEAGGGGALQRVPDEAGAERAFRSVDCGKVGDLDSGIGGFRE
ncbi:hypothetical protein Fmac_030946 [Flemingia macrophylla]|uniref:Uncharacterized protein n=1 Tax=Flemingia macrophylla TaxID=520843 RepID=A0ABD1L0M6_9FABA